MTFVLQIIYFASGVIVFAEALNKLQRTSPFAPAMTRQQRIVDGLKAIAWALLAAGGFYAVFLDVLLRLPPPTFREVCVMAGFAVLIIRTRVKEG